ncbi:pseudaminic acid cytidylyltransferase [Pelagibacteraceae bacterium]|nr:pseudaminic acid cytidylyltransferase [Pelagibacteraceae bacterium]
MNICIVPARGGSKRIANKNIKLFSGKPMIYWSLKTIKEAKIFDKIIVSTDSAEISKVSSNLGAEVPFIRPDDISNDKANIHDVMYHSSRWIQENYPSTKIVSCIFPTAPMIETSDLKQALSRIRDESWDYVISAVKIDNRILRGFTLENDERLRMYCPQYQKTLSQDLPDVFMDAAQFYFGKITSWLNKKDFFSKETSPIFIDSSRVQDIDNEKDWIEAETKFTKYISRKKN